MPTEKLLGGDFDAGPEREVFYLSENDGYCITGL